MVLPRDEWDAIALNYTSGTTGNPKGVVYHHRGAYLERARQHHSVCGMRQHPVYLWTLADVPLQRLVLSVDGDGAGRDACLPAPGRGRARSSMRSREHGVTHLCGAPIVMNMLLNDRAAEGRVLPRQVKMMTAGAAPPAAVIEGMEAKGFQHHPCLRPDRGLRAGGDLRLARRMGRAARRRARAAQDRARGSTTRCSTG